jgi:plasmid stabilization system protein ParE
VRHIHDYIAQDSPIYARRTSEALIKKTIGLDERPRKGRKVPELNDDAAQELSLYSYRILYEIKSDKLIEVLAVIHKRQHFRHYESGASQPTLDAIRRLALALGVTTDELIFDEDERGPDEELRLQFEALTRFTQEEKKITKAVLESLILKHDANRFSATG